MQLLCTLRVHCRQWPRNTRYQAGRYPLLGPDFHRLDRTSFWLAHSFYHLVGAREQDGRNVETKLLGSFTIDEKLERCWSFHREVTWFGALQYLVDINGGPATDRPLINPIRHQ